MWLNVFLSSLSVWVSVCMTWNKLPTASPSCVPAVPPPRPAPPRPRLCPQHRPAHHQGCHTLSTHRAGEQPTAPASNPSTCPPLCSSPPLPCCYAGPLAPLLGDCHPGTTCDLAGTEWRGEEEWSLEPTSPRPHFLAPPPKSPIQPSLGRWEGTGPEQRVGLCRTPGGLRPRPCDLRPRRPSPSLRPLPVISAQLTQGPRGSVKAIPGRLGPLGPRLLSLAGFQVTGTSALGSQLHPGGGRGPNSEFCRETLGRGSGCHLPPPNTSYLVSGEQGRRGHSIGPLPTPFSRSTALRWEGPWGN